jgi:hypothetical protein
MARPKSPDPSTQKAIYPRRSVWEKVVAAAEADNKKPAEMAVILMELGLIAINAGGSDG